MSATVVSAQQAPITILSPKPYQVFQRTATNRGNIIIKGTYTGVATAVEARWKGQPWAVIDSAPATGKFSGSLVKLAGQGTVEIRLVNRPTVFASIPFVGIGDVFVTAGQSNSVGEAINMQTYHHPSLKAALFGNDNHWRELVDPTDSSVGQINPVSIDRVASGSAWPNFATIYLADQKVPVAFIPTAKAGSTIAQWKRDDANPKNPKTLYGNLLLRVDAVNTEIKGVLWLQGESDVTFSTEAVHKNALNALVNNFAADLGGAKTVIAEIGDNKNVPAGGDLEVIRRALRSVAKTNVNAFPGPLLYDIPVDIVHFTSDYAIGTVGSRFAAATLKGFFGGARDGEGPKALTAEKRGANIVIKFQDQSLPVLTPPGSGGFVVKNSSNEVITTTSISATAPDEITLVLDQNPTDNLTVIYGVGHWNVTAIAPTDSSSYHLPLLPFSLPAVIVSNVSDLSHDGVVDNSDYNIFVSAYGKTGAPGFIPADINKDGNVDIFDYNVLVGSFGK